MYFGQKSYGMFLYSVYTHKWKSILAITFQNFSQCSGIWQQTRPRGRRRERPLTPTWHNSLDSIFTRKGSLILLDGNNAVEIYKVMQQIQHLHVVIDTNSEIHLSSTKWTKEVVFLSPILKFFALICAVQQVKPASDQRTVEWLVPSCYHRNDVKPAGSKGQTQSLMSLSQHQQTTRLHLLHQLSKSSWLQAGELAPTLLRDYTSALNQL